MIRNILIALTMIIWWLLALYGLIVSRAPDLKDEFDKIIPLQWAIGIILLIMWVLDFLHIFDYLLLLKSNMLIAVLWLASVFTKLILWFVLSYALITKYVFAQAPKTKKKWRKKKWELTREQKTEKMYKRLTLIQVPFGFISVALGFIAIVFMIMSLFN